MSIAQALGISEEKLFKKIPEKRIKHIGHDNSEMLETFPLETVINADNEEDRKALEGIFNA